MMRDEKAGGCAVCGTDLRRAPRGRPARYCSRACQAKAYRRRSRPVPDVAPSTGRRRQIAEAVWRIAAHRGLHAASMREIAAEAGVSVRVLQYHYATKQRLLVDALTLLHQHNERRARHRIRVDPADHRALLGAVLAEFLPLDAQRRLALRVFAAYYARSLTDPALAAVFLDEDQPLERLVAEIISAAHRQGRAAPGVHPRHEADALVATAVGLGGDVLHGRRTLGAVQSILDYHLDRVLPPTERTREDAAAVL